MRQRLNIVNTRNDHVNALVNIVPYSLVAALQERLERRNFQVIICDEVCTLHSSADLTLTISKCHHIKSSDAQRTQVLIPLLQKARRRILLSGTPALSRPAELYPQLQALDSTFLSSFHRFGLRYCNARQGPRGWDYSGSCHLTELRTLASQSPLSL